MIINDLMGGLGNQLFQISAGFAHAKNIKTDYAINYKIGSIYNGQGHPHMRYKDNLYQNGRKVLQLLKLMKKLLMKI